MAQRPGGLPLVHVSDELVTPQGVTVLRNRGGLPLFQIPTNSNIPCGRPKCDIRHGGLGGPSPYFRIVSVGSCRSTLTERRT